MTLREALSLFIQGLGYSGTFAFNEALELGHDTLCLIADAGEHNSDPTRFRKFPALELRFRDPNQDSAQASARLVYDALNTGRPINLQPSYRVGRCVVALPGDSTRDDQGRWVVSLTANFSTHFSALV